MQKFIVTAEGHLKYGNVNMHKDLLSYREACIGGGLYEFDYVNSRMYLWGKSYDFGRVKWSYIDTVFLPSSLEGLTIFYEDLPLTEFVDIQYSTIPDKTNKT